MSYPVMDEAMLFKLASVVELPDVLVPDSGNTCSHGNKFSDGDESLTLRHKEVIVYEESSEQKLGVKVKSKCILISVRKISTKLQI